jgi:hypothetical protein
MQGQAHRVVKLRGGESDNQTKPSDYTPKEHMALLYWQLAGSGHESGKLVVAEGKHWRKNHPRAIPYGVIFAATVNLND